MAFEEQLLTALNSLNNQIDNLSSSIKNPGDRDRPDTPPSSGRTYNWDVGGVSSTFGKILNNTSGDLRVYTEAVTSALQSVMPSFLSVNDTLKVTTDALVDLATSSVMVSQNLRKFGLARQADLMDTFRLASSLNMTLSDFERFIMQNSQSLIQFGGSVEGGVSELKQFQRLLREDSEFEGMIGYLMSMGMTFKEINEYLTDYLSKNRALGLMEDEDRRKKLQEAIDFRTVLQGVSDATGLLVDELTKETESAASIAAKLNYGQSAPMAIALADTATQLGSTPAAHVILTGMLNPNDPTSKYFASMYPKTYAMALEIHRMMKAGQDVSPEMVKSFISQLQKEGQAVASTYGGVAAAAGLNDLGGLIAGQGPLSTGAPVDTAISQNQELQAQYAAGQISTATDSILGVMAELSQATELTGVFVSNAIDGIQEQMVTISEEVGNLIKGVADGAISVSSARVKELEDKTKQAVNELDTTIARLKEEGFEEEAEKLQKERNALQKQLEALTAAKEVQEGTRSKEQLEDLLTDLDITLPEDDRSTVDKILDVALVAINDEAFQKFRGLFDPVPLDPNDPDIDDIQGESGAQILLGGLGTILSNAGQALLNTMFPTAEASTIDVQPTDSITNSDMFTNYIQLKAAMDSAKAALGVPDSQLEEMLAIMNDTAQLEVLQKQMEVQQGLRGDLQTIMMNIQKAAETMANATKWSAIHTAEQAATATVGARVNATVGPIHRSPR